MELHLIILLTFILLKSCEPSPVLPLRISEEGEPVPRNESLLDVHLESRDSAFGTRHQSAMPGHDASDGSSPGSPKLSYHVNLTEKFNTDTRPQQSPELPNGSASLLRRPRLLHTRIKKNKLNGQDSMSFGNRNRGGLKTKRLNFKDETEEWREEPVVDDIIKRYMSFVPIKMNSSSLQADEESTTLKVYSDYYDELYDMYFAEDSYFVTDDDQYAESATDVPLIESSNETSISDLYRNSTTDSEFGSGMETDEKESGRFDIASPPDSVFIVSRSLPGPNAVIDPPITSSTKNTPSSTSSSPTLSSTASTQLFPSSTTSSTTLTPTMTTASASSIGKGSTHKEIIQPTMTPFSTTKPSVKPTAGNSTTSKAMPQFPLRERGFRYTMLAALKAKGKKLVSGDLLESKKILPGRSNKRNSSLSLIRKLTQEKLVSDENIKIKNDTLRNSNLFDKNEMHDLISLNATEENEFGREDNSSVAPVNVAPKLLPVSENNRMAKAAKKVTSSTSFSQAVVKKVSSTSDISVSPSFHKPVDFNSINSQFGVAPQGTNPQGSYPLGLAPLGIAPEGFFPFGDLLPDQESTPLAHNESFDRFHVQIKTETGSINGGYVVVNPDTGAVNAGVQYEAVEDVDPKLIQETLMTFLGFDPRLDPFKL